MVKFIIPNDKIPETPSRKEYFYDVFHEYFVKIPSQGPYEEYVSFPFGKCEYLFIFGHNNQTIKYFKTHKDIQAQYFIIISCFPEEFIQKFPKLKNVYFSKTDDSGYTCTRYGKAYGFDFDITDSELMFYTDGDTNILERLNHTFDKVA